MRSALDQVLAVLDGERPTLDADSLKILYFMLESNAGCDATITPDKFVIQYGWHLSLHPYTADLAPRVVSWLLAASTGGYLPGGTMPWWFPDRAGVEVMTFGYDRDRKAMSRIRTEPIGPHWSYGPRRIWIDLEPARVVVMVRDATTDPGADAHPAPIEPPPTFLVGDHACPHCGAVPDRYRRLRDGSLVCAACGRSSTRLA